MNNNNIDSDIYSDNIYVNNNTNVNSSDGIVNVSDNGAYFYQENSNDFAIDRFNRNFDQYLEKRKYQMRKNMINKLDKLNQPPKEISIYQQPVGNILIATKDSIFNILDDILQNKISINTFIKNNRMFHLGLIMILFALIIFFYMIITGDY